MENQDISCSALDSLFIDSYWGE